MKKGWKRLTAILFSVAMVFSAMFALVSCGKPNGGYEVAVAKEYTDEGLKVTEGTFTASDGRHIYGATVISEDYDGKSKLPAVILSHGYGGTFDTTLARAYKFAKEGYVCYSYDFCGGSVASKSDGDFSKMTVDSEESDLNEVIKYISAQSFTDKKHIFLYGESMGGFISTVVASKQPSKIAGMILIYPALSIPTDCHYDRELTGRADFIATGEKYYGKEDEMFAKCTMPVLIFHGTIDLLVDISYSEHAVEVFPNAKLVKVPLGGHGFIPAQYKPLYPEMIDFLNGIAK